MRKQLVNVFRSRPKLFLWFAMCLAFTINYLYLHLDPDTHTLHFALRPFVEEGAPLLSNAASLIYSSPDKDNGQLSWRAFWRQSLLTCGPTLLFFLPVLAFHLMNGAFFHSTAELLTYASLWIWGALLAIRHRDWINQPKTSQSKSVVNPALTPALPAAVPVATTKTEPVDRSRWNAVSSVAAHQEKAVAQQQIRR